MCGGRYSGCFFPGCCFLPGPCRQLIIQVFCKAAGQCQMPQLMYQGKALPVARPVAANNNDRGPTHPRSKPVEFIPMERI